MRLEEEQGVGVKRILTVTNDKMLGEEGVPEELRLEEMTMDNGRNEAGRRGTIRRESKMCSN